MIGGLSDFGGLGCTFGLFGLVSLPFDFVIDTVLLPFDFVSWVFEEPEDSDNTE